MDIDLVIDVGLGNDDPVPGFVPFTRMANLPEENEIVREVQDSSLPVGEDASNEKKKNSASSSKRPQSQVEDDGLTTVISHNPKRLRQTAGIQATELIQNNEENCDESSSSDSDSYLDIESSEDYDDLNSPSKENDKLPEVESSSDEDSDRSEPHRHVRRIFSSSESSSSKDDEPEAMDTSTESASLYPGRETPKPSRSRKSQSPSSESDKVKENTAQEASIFKINMKLFQFVHPVQIINSIMENYKAEDGKPFRAKTISNFQEVALEDRVNFKGEDFQIKLYVKSVKSEIPLLNCAGVDDESSVTVHTLFFFYRTKEIFAVTTGTCGWRPVKQYADLDFVIKMKQILLSKEGHVKSSSMMLNGVSETQDITTRLEVKSSIFNQLALKKKITANVRKNSSILQLSCLHKPKSTKGEESFTPKKISEDDVIKLKVIVRKESIRFEKHLTLSNYLSVLGHLSVIAKGEKTYELFSRNVEEISTVHDEFLDIAPSKVANVLNIDLSNLIHKALKGNGQLYGLENFEISHPNTKEFFFADNFKLHSSNINKPIKTWNCAPSITEIIEALKSCRVLKIPMNPEEDNKKVFLKKLNTMKITFTGPSRIACTDKVLNFVNGIYVPKNMVYWHVQQRWFILHVDYIIFKQNQLIEILKEKLLTDKDNPAFLKSSWPIGDKETTPDKILETYLDNCSESEENWVPKSEFKGKTLFDMMKLVPNSEGGLDMILYYFIPNLNYKTVENGLKLTKSADEMRNALNAITEDSTANVGGTQATVQNLRNLYKKISEKKPHFKTACPTLANFEQKLSSATIVIAFGRELQENEDGRRNRTLEEEMNVQSKMTVENIVQKVTEIIQRNDADEMNLLELTNLNAGTLGAEALINKLKTYGYLNSRSNMTAKFLNQSKLSFKIPIPTVAPDRDDSAVNAFLYENFCEPMQPQLNKTFLSKLEIIRIQQEFNKIGIKSYHFLEIPLQD